jgi:hypothetical protein
MTLFGQENLLPVWSAGTLFDLDQAKAGFSSTAAVRKLMNKSRHYGTMHSNAARVFAHALAFIRGDCEKGGHQSKGNGSAQIRQGLKRQQKALNYSLVSPRKRRIRVHRKFQGEDLDSPPPSPPKQRC